jgi:hypothetical protein
MVRSFTLSLAYQEFAVTERSVMFAAILVSVEVAKVLAGQLLTGKNTGWSQTRDVRSSILRIPRSRQECPQGGSNTRPVPSEEPPSLRM